MTVEILNIFSTLKQISWKTKTFFKNLDYHFLVESTNTENISFPYETAISEANVKTNRMVITKWTYHKEWSFASNYFIFLKFLFQFKNFLKRVDLMYWWLKCFILFLSTGVLFEDAFSLWVTVTFFLLKFWNFVSNAYWVLLSNVVVLDVK